MRVDIHLESKETGTIAVSIDAEKHTDPDQLTYLAADTLGEARKQVAQGLWEG